LMIFVKADEVLLYSSCPILSVYITWLGLALTRGTEPYQMTV
jgi:hypothetical protein